MTVTTGTGLDVPKYNIISYIQYLVTREIDIE
jgi:hypothetical protein